MRLEPCIRNALGPVAQRSEPYGKQPGPLIGPAARIIDDRLLVAGRAPRGFDPQSAVWVQTPSA